MSGHIECLTLFNTRFSVGYGHQLWKANIGCATNLIVWASLSLFFLTISLLAESLIDDHSKHSYTKCEYIYIYNTIILSITITTSATNYCILEVT